MLTSSNNFVFSEPPQTTAGTDHIALALWHYTDQFSLSFYYTIDGILKEAFDRAGIRTHQWSGLLRARAAVFVIEVDDRRTALPAVEAAIRQKVPLLMPEIAYYDRAEDYWRTVYPAGAAAFTRFISPESIQASRRWIEANDPKVMKTRKGEA